MPTGPGRRACRRPDILAAVLALLWSPWAGADQALVAVASNFGETAYVLEEQFEASSGDTLTLVTGSTGKLYAQIVNGAPFDAFLAADQAHPRLLEADGLAVQGSRFTYAVGRLSLWSAEPGRVAVNGADTLAQGNFRALALANPRLAPYGAATLEAIRALGLDQALRDRLVMGENVAQAHAMIATGNAELGFVALSQVLTTAGAEAGSRWDVPAGMHEPLRQDAVLLSRGQSNMAAGGFLRFLASPDARRIIQLSGYGTE